MTTVVAPNAAQQQLLDEAQQEIPWDMTPMIDCVFLLLIFFVLVIDLSQTALEDLVLPKATFQVPDVAPADRRPVVNVLQSGAVWFRGELQYDPTAPGADAASLRRLFDRIRTTAGLRTELLRQGDREVAVVVDPVLLRADKWADWSVVGEVLRRGAEAGFRRIELALSDQDRERGLPR